MDVRCRHHQFQSCFCDRISHLNPKLTDGQDWPALGYLAVSVHSTRLQLQVLIATPNFMWVGVGIQIQVLLLNVANTLHTEPYLQLPIFIL